MTMRAVLILAALAISMGAAWGQTTCPQIAVDRFRCGASIIDRAGNLYDEADNVIERVLTAAPLSRPTHVYTLDDIDRMRAAEMKIKPPHITTWEWEGVIELRLHTDILANISPEALEQKAGEGK
jgi:hypothetical protein